MADLTPESTSLGTVSTPEGDIEIRAFLRVFRDERESTIVQLADDSFVLHTRSTLEENQGEVVQAALLLTRKTLIQLMEAAFLGTSYFGIDLQQEIVALASGDSTVDFECGGNGPFPASRLLDSSESVEPGEG